MVRKGKRSEAQKQRWRRMKETVGEAAGQPTFTQSAHGSSVLREYHGEPEHSSGRSGEGLMDDVSMDPGSVSEQHQHGTEEDELDGFPVIAADEEDCDMDSSSSVKGRQSDEQDENESWKEGTSFRGANTGENAQTSQVREVPSQTEVNPYLQDPCGGYDTETLYSPLLNIKDEPIDEGYDKALIAQSDPARVKQELETGDQEAPPDELRISSVFSVRGDEAISVSAATSQPPPFSALGQSAPTIKVPAMVPPVQVHPHLQPKALGQRQPLLQTQGHPQPPSQPSPQPPPSSVRICCSGCSKVLQKGQTAFQRKGSNQLFCSTVCLTGFNLPPSINFTQKKTCHLCLKMIGNPKDLITVPIDAANTLKEFCSQACLTIYKSRGEGFLHRCFICKNPNEILHEVNHQGFLHRLCSDDCFSRFRSSKRLSMSCCESCGSCTVTGNYHLAQIDDAVKKFCSPICITAFKQKSGKLVHCPYCNEFKAVDQMLEGTNTQGVVEFFCSSRCLTNSQASRTLSGAAFPCTNCQKLSIPQYHLAMPDGSIRNFCSYECVGGFQERLDRTAPPPHTNRGSVAAPLSAPNTSARGPSYPSVAPCPPAPLHAPTQVHNPSASYTTTPCQSLPPTCVPTSKQTPFPPYGAVSGLAKPQDHQRQQPNGPPSTYGSIKLTCKQCQGQISSKPEVFQFKNHTGLFCSRMCCDTYKREEDVRAVCEYCKQEKVVKDIVVFEHRPRPFCCEGCKLLFKHDLAKQHGAQCRICVYCCNLTHSSVQNHFGGKLEEFCTEECMSLYTVLFYEMAKCHGCKTQGILKESLRWDETMRHFCNLHCLLQFCSKCINPDQPSSNGVTSATEAQAPLSLSKDMPVIGGVVSLASALAGNTALTGALPSAKCTSKIIGDASTQTDVAAHATTTCHRRMLKNKALMCKPIAEERAVQCELDVPRLLGDTVLDENGEKVRLVPVPVPVPVPVYIPLPMHLYTQFTPVPVGLPLPLPVPVVVSASEDAKGSAPSQSSVEDEDVEKSQCRPLCHGDQGSTYSGDLESDARSTPFSWDDAEDTTHNRKALIPSPEMEGASMLDLEHDFPLASNDNGAGREVRAAGKRRRRGKRGRRRLVTDVVSSVGSGTSSSTLYRTYGVRAWESWVQTRAQRADANPLTVKEDLLQCSAVELSNGLCCFISEVRRPNGQTYAPDSVYYLCLGIQQHLLENGRLENIFMDPLYSQFTADITKLLKSWECTLPQSGFLESRVEESFLWECKQLGALSPFVLLNTLLFFGVKLLGLKTLGQHQRLSFSNIARCSSVTEDGSLSYLRFRFTTKHEVSERQNVFGKRKREPEDGEVFRDLPENTENPLHCPVRLYEFYLSKCSDSVKQRPEPFYLQPLSPCHADSALWYSAQVLDSGVLESMLVRALAVRDAHLQACHESASSDEESS